MTAFLQNTSGRLLLLIFVLYSLDQCFSYFQQKLITIKEKYVIVYYCHLLLTISYRKMTDMLYKMYSIIMFLALYSSKFYTVFNDTFRRLAARYYNNAKRQPKLNRFCLKLFKGQCIYEVHTERAWGCLEVSQVFVDSIVFKQYIYIVHLFGWGEETNCDQFELKAKLTP